MIDHKQKANDTSAKAGNKLAVKYKTAEHRKVLFDAALEHLRAGYTKSLFPEADWKTFLSYAAQFPDEFEQDEIDRATREGHLKIEKRIMDIASGEVKCDPQSMTALVWSSKNKMGWRDKTDHEITGKDGGVIATANAIVTGDELKAMILQAEDDV